MRNIRKAQKQIDSREHNTCLLSVTPTDVTNNIVLLIKKSFTKDDVIVVSLSIAASNLAQLPQIDQCNLKIVGGAAPGHYIDLPESDEEINVVLDSFKGKKQMMLLASEIKLMARPQTKNESSNFNKSFSKAVEDTENILHSDGFKSSFIDSANDGVACDS
eukprot:11431171-Ditylum_brightwellii.AAC.1